MSTNKPRAISESKFAMLRTSIALAWVDSNLCNSERKLLDDHLGSYSLSGNQLEIINRDLEKPALLSEIFPQVTELRDRTQLINFARVLFHIDKNLCEKEEDALEYLYKIHSELNKTHKPQSNKSIIAKRELFSDNTTQDIFERSGNKSYYYSDGDIAIDLFTSILDNLSD